MFRKFLFAASFLPLVPCGSAGQLPCTPCSLFQAVKNATDLVFYGITGPVAAFMFVFAGGMILLYGASPTMLNRGKTLATNTAYGVAIILLAWLGTDFLIKGIANGNAGDNWYQFTCPAYLAAINVGDTATPSVQPFTPVPTPEQVTLDNVTADQYQAVALAHKEPYPRQNSPALIQLIQCMYSDPVVKALAKPMPNLAPDSPQAGVATYDNANPFCNYSRGVPLPGGACSHPGGTNCHYGGRNGTNGAEAVDITARRVPVSVPGTDDGTGKPRVVQANDDQLFCELVRVLVIKKQCPGVKLVNWEVNHTHISTTACDMDGVGISSSAPGKTTPTCTYLGSTQ